MNHHRPIQAASPLVGFIPIVALALLCIFPTSVYIQPMGITISRLWFSLFAGATNCLFGFLDLHNRFSLNCLQSVLISLIPIEIVMAVVFLQHCFIITLILVSFSAAAALALRLFAAAAFKSELHDRKYDKPLKTVVGRISLQVLALTMSITLLGGSVFYFQDKYYEKPSVTPSSSIEQTEGNLVKTHIDRIAKLEGSAWETLDVAEKLDVLQTLLNIETTYLAIDPQTLICKKLGNGTLGEYSQAKKAVYIDKDSLADPEECINTVCHEARHAYQHYVVDTLDWDDQEVQHGFYYRDARRWRDNFDHYVDGSDDSGAYYSQRVEEDARRYGFESCYIYLAYIEDYCCNHDS